MANTQVEAEPIRHRGGPDAVGACPFPEVWVPATRELESMEIVAGLESGDADATGTSEELTP